MEIITMVGTVGILGIFGIILWKLLTHPTTGKIKYYYKDKYQEHQRKNFPPF
jgi:hypothetical protein